MPQKTGTTQKKKPASSFLSSSMPVSKSTKERVKTLETHSTAKSAPPVVEANVRADKRELAHTLKQSQAFLLTTAARQLSKPRQGFMKCLLEVEEEKEATHPKAVKTRVLLNKKPSRPCSRVPTSGPSPSPPLPRTHAVATAMAVTASWVQMPASVLVPSSAGVIGPGSVLEVQNPIMNVSWKKTDFLLQSNEKNLNYTKIPSEQEEERSLVKFIQNLEKFEEHLTAKQEEESQVPKDSPESLTVFHSQQEAFRSYFEIFKGHGEVDAQSLENILVLMGISLMPTQVEAALISADVDGDGHVTFKDFLTVMTDSKRFFSSVEQNALADVGPLNPYTLFFEILSLLIEMLALPEAALEEITNYYQKKLKEGTTNVQETESNNGRLQSRKKISLASQQEETFVEIPERKVLRILNQLKQQNYGTNPQSAYPQMSCIPFCPRLNTKTGNRKQNNNYMLDQCTTTYLGRDIRSLLLQSSSQGNREYNSEDAKWLSSVLARTH